MIKVINTEKKPIKLWANNIENTALEQAKNLANLPFVFKWVSIMPDGHTGYGMPIGGVIATQDVIIPNAVGADIGCGMHTVKTNINNLSNESLSNIVNKIKETIPVGFNCNHDKTHWIGFNHAPDNEIINQNLEKSKFQLGTLGGGNHFIEIQKDKDNYIWIMIHSGSRNIGYKIASYFHKIAVQNCEKYYSNIPSKDLSFLPLNTKNSDDYIECMNFALRFAKKNRQIMMSKINHIFQEEITDTCFEPFIDVHHNYARWENHFNKNVMIHRKGATSAKKDELGIIPGSQGTKSYIVEGLGNEESFESCSHGAGRTLGRKEAKRKLNLSEEKDKMSGILHSIIDNDDLDEAPGAYKNIDIVMENQQDLVKIVHELHPMAVIKG